MAVLIGRKLDQFFGLSCLSCFVQFCGCGAKTVEDYLAEGDYASAYSNAADDQKRSVYIESVLAFFSNVSVQAVQDRSSFKVLDAYYREWSTETGGGESMIIYASGSVGNGSDSNYFVYNHTNDSDWETLGVLSSPDESYTESHSGEWGSESQTSFYIAAALLDAVLTGSDEHAVRVDINSINRVNDLVTAGALDNTAMVERPGQ